MLATLITASIELRQAGPGPLSLRVREADLGKGASARQQGWALRLDLFDLKCSSSIACDSVLRVGGGLEHV